MPLRDRGGNICRRSVYFAWLLGACALAADSPLAPVTVCEILKDLPLHEGKEVAVLGRYSFRQNGRWIAEQACDPASPAPPLLWLTEDSTGAPKPPDNFELDAAALNRKFTELRRRTSLGKFRFGTSDYDRWAVVYCRVMSRKGEAASQAPADLVFRGSGVVVFLTIEK
jgi:hypothetical protein